MYENVRNTGARAIILRKSFFPFKIPSDTAHFLIERRFCQDDYVWAFSIIGIFSGKLVGSAFGPDHFLAIIFQEIPYVFLSGISAV